MFLAAKETAGALQRFAAGDIHAAVRAGNHRFAGGRSGGAGALARKPGHKEVDDRYRDDEK